MLEKNLLESDAYLALSMNEFRGSKGVAIRTQSFTFLTPDQSSLSDFVQILPSFGGKMITNSSRLTLFSLAILAAEECLISCNLEEP